MNLQLNKNSIIALVGLIVTLSIIVGAYYYVIIPMKNEVKMLENELKTEEKLYETISAQVADTKNEVVLNTKMIQKKLPVDSLVQQFILDLEKAEVVSSSLIENMSFQDNDITEKDVIIESDEEPAAEEEETADTPLIPEGIKRTTVNLNVTSKDYFDLHKFLETIEQLERVTKIDSLSFTGGEEVLSLDQEIEELSYSVVLSTFYYPKLEELKAELPIFETPPPGNKDNPLATGMFYQDNSEKDKDDQQTEDE